MTQNRHQRKANLAKIGVSWRGEKSPANIRMVRLGHNRLCDAVEANNNKLANEILASMPNKYKAVIALLGYQVKFDGWIRRPKAPKEMLIEVVQEDQLDQWRRGIAAMEQSIEEQRPVQAEEKAKAEAEKQYGRRETLYFIGHKRASKEGEPYRVRVNCVSGLPEPVPDKPSMSVWADGFGQTIQEAADDAIFEARFRYVQSLVAAGVEKNMEAGRERASKAELYLSHLEGV